jgi:hypothetical protein
VVGKKGVIDYFEYPGHGTAGYSGAPILNPNIEVIGIHEGSLYNDTTRNESKKITDIGHSLIPIVKYLK